MTSTRWVFTLNNYTDAEVQSISDWLDASVVYGTFGREVGANGTPHLQGFIILHSPQRLSYLRTHVSARGHFEKARGTSTQARDYCHKDADFVEYGVFPERQGKRSDIDRLVEWADDWAAANGSAPLAADIAREQPSAFVRYPRFIELCQLRQPRLPVQEGELSEWQQTLGERLSEDADDRTIDFVIDAEGGKGKTWFCRWMLSHHKGCQVLAPGKKTDLAYIISESNWIFLFNCARGQMEFLSYQLLEQLKDRMVLSTKYSGTMKVWMRNVHVVVFANEEPDYDKMTADRYNVISI